MLELSNKTYSYSELKSDLQDKGFLFFDGISIPEMIHAHFFNLDNYDPENTIDPKAHDYSPVDPMMSHILTAALLDRFPCLINASSITWEAKIMYQGYKMDRHREYSSSGTATFYFLTWLTPYPFEGREFRYGMLTDTRLISSAAHCPGYSSDILFSIVPQGVEGTMTLGSLKPQTGRCCLLDRVCPKWWHAVDEMTAGGPVVMIGASIK